MLHAVRAIIIISNSYENLSTTYTIYISMCAYVLSPQSHLTLCDAIDCYPPGSSVHGILQTRMLE